MNANETLNSVTRHTAKELRALPAAERDAILLAAAKIAELEYRTNRELTAFEACGKEDLYGESANTKSRSDLAG